MNKIAQAELRGFFWGEGCIDIIKYFSKKRNQYFYRPRIRIGMNIKETPLLKEIQKVFGGWFSYRKTTNSICWELFGKKRLKKILPCLKGGFLNAYKKKEIDLLEQIISFIPIQGKKYSQIEKDKIEYFYHKLQEIKKCPATE